MAKVERIEHFDKDNKPDGKGVWMIYSPGDDQFVPFDDRWDFNGDLEKPTFSPSMLVNANIPGKRNHFFVTNGKIQYLSDCDHKMAGKTVDMVDCDY